MKTKKASKSDSRPKGYLKDQLERGGFTTLSYDGVTYLAKENNTHIELFRKDHDLYIYAGILERKVM